MADYAYDGTWERTLICITDPLHQDELLTDRLSPHECVTAGDVVYGQMIKLTCQNPGEY